MQLKINKKNDRPLLGRVEVVGEIMYDSSTPSRVQLKKEIAKALKSEENSVAVQEITPLFGVRKSMIRAHVYKTNEDMNKYESKVYIKRDSKAPKKKEGE